MASIMGLHLQYRLWIAEMNADINVLRIFDDYLEEIKAKDDSDKTSTQINYYKQQFINLRKEMDELRHEMHLNKMKLAAFAKAQNASMENIEDEMNHKTLEENYKRFRKNFTEANEAFKKFADNNDKHI